MFWEPAALGYATKHKAPVSIGTGLHDGCCYGFAETLAGGSWMPEGAQQTMAARLRTLRALSK